MVTRKVRDTTVTLVMGDITLQEIDAIVNAANSALSGGGGVDGAIHRAGGPEILQECRQHKRCPAGQAVITGGGRLKARFVVHAVGPVWDGGEKGEPDLLADAYRNSLELAAQSGAKTIAFPSISTGAYKFPLRMAASIAVREVFRFSSRDNSICEVRFVFIDPVTFEAFRQALEGSDANEFSGPVD